MSLPTGSEFTSVLLVEKMIPEAVTVDDDYEYMIKLTNLTDNLLLEDLVVTDRLDRNYAYATSTPAGTFADGVGRWQMAALAPGDSQVITVRGAASAAGPLEFCTTVAYVPVVCIDTLAEQPALRITYTGDTERITCDDILYTITVCNTGTGVAENVRVSVPLPDGVTAAGARTFSTTVGDLAAGQCEEISFVAESSRAGVFTSSATATSDNVPSVESTTVTTNVCQPALSISGSGTALTYLGTPAAYEATVTNTSDCVVADATATIVLPACLEFVSASGNGTHAAGTVTFMLGDLAAGATRTISVNARGADVCTSRVEFTADGVCAEAVSDVQPVEVQGIPAILLEVIDTDDPVRVGSTTTYVIVATNQGSAVGTNIRIDLEVEDFEIVGQTGPTTGTISGKTITFAPLARLEVGAEAEWRVEVRATAAGDQRTRVNMNTDQLTRPVTETEATYTYE